MQKIIAVATLIIALSVINWSIYKKEGLLETGKVVYLKLAPVDPRSLMQGDYMSLRFAMANQIDQALLNNESFQSTLKAKEGFEGLVDVQLDDKSIASFQKVNTTGITDNKTVLQFRLRKGRVKFATNAYFFEEGSGSELTQARYGEFRVAENGELLLVALRDENLKKLG